MKTSHMKARMSQRAITDEMVDLVLNEGELNHRGDRLSLNRKQLVRIKEDYEKLGKWNKRLMHIIERMMRRGGMTVVCCGSVGITTYFGVQ